MGMLRTFQPVRKEGTKERFSNRTSVAVKDHLDLDPHPTKIQQASHKQQAM